jgi:hypothetical protein
MRRFPFPLLLVVAALAVWLPVAAGAAGGATQSAVTSSALVGPQDGPAASEAGREAGPEQSNVVGAGGQSPSSPQRRTGSAVQAAVTYRVYATIYDPNTPGSVEASVPDKCVKFASLGWTGPLAQQCPLGAYPLGLNYNVQVRTDGGQSAVLPVKDVGPWNIDDNYWDPPSGVRPRRVFANLPQGTPESQAAFYNGYNVVNPCLNLDGVTSSGHAGPADQFNRCVLNPAGLDLSVAAASELGLSGSSWVTVSFLWETPPTGGYWLAASDGGIFTFGDANYFGSTGAMALNKPVVGMAPTHDRGGYWLVASDGGIFTFGDANYFGSTGAMALNKPIVGMAPTADGGGYWLVASDGGIFTFGDARFFGSTGAMALNKPIVGMAPTADGGGYWLVASDGGIFTFGDANYFGSTGSMALNKPIVGMAATRDGGGYWLVASDGGIFTFGDAQFDGSTGSLVLNRPIVGMAPTADGGGYWLVASDGGVFTFGDAGFWGSTGGLPLNRPVVGLSSS